MLSFLILIPMLVIHMLALYIECLRVDYRSTGSIISLKEINTSIWQGCNTLIKSNKDFL